MDAREIIADLAGRYVDHYDEMSLLDDSQKVMVPVKLLRLAYEKAMGVSQPKSPKKKRDAAEREIAS